MPLFHVKVYKNRKYNIQITQITEALKWVEITREKMAGGTRKYQSVNRRDLYAKNSKI